MKLMGMFVEGPRYKLVPRLEVGAWADLNMAGTVDEGAKMGLQVQLQERHIQRPAPGQHGWDGVSWWDVGQPIFVGVKVHGHRACGWACAFADRRWRLKVRQQAEAASDRDQLVHEVAGMSWTEYVESRE